MDQNHTHQHITPLKVYGVVLVVLLALTFITIYITSIHLGAFTVATALIIASIKVFIVLAYFMHLKFDQPIFKIMVGAIFLLLAVIIVLTFSDYYFR